MLSEFRNILLVSGSGRNCGKTTVACNIINQLKRNRIVYGLKITPHFHKTGDLQQIVEEGNGYKIYRETDYCSGKDSSRMLVAGAKEVYFIQCSDENLLRIYARTKQLIPEGYPIVCESGSFATAYKPGLHILVVGADIDDSKKSYYSNLRKAEIITTSDEFTQSNLSPLISYAGTSWTINKNDHD